MKKSSVLDRTGVVRCESSLWIGAATAAVFTLYGDAWLMDLSGALWYGFLFVCLFAVMLWLAFGVVRHADSLAVILGEPYGTLILTVSVISIEVVMISAVMRTGEGNPTLARDTLLAVFMIVLNGMLGTRRAALRPIPFLIAVLTRRRSFSTTTITRRYNGLVAFRDGGDTNPALAAIFDRRCL